MASRKWRASKFKRRHLQTISVGCEIRWLTPAWILFVRLYEERELEIRFGESYLHYKTQTPFF
jgi:protein-S-isoprenylcysteine O-methyltransferase Ste14